MSRRWVVTVLGLLLVAGVSIAAAPPAGKPAPAFALTLFDGRQVTLKGFLGKPVVIDFWHSG